MIRILSLSVWAFMLLFPAYALAEEVVIDRILVKINSSIITQYDLDEELKPILAQIKGRTLSSTEQEQFNKLKKQTLDKMVNDTLLAQEIKKYEIVISDEVLDQEVTKIQEEQGISADGFEARIAEDGETIESFRSKLKGMIEKQELLGYMVHSKVLVTDTEIQKEYETRREDYLLEKMVELAIILLPAEVAALEVKKRIEDGELTFAEAATK